MLYFKHKQCCNLEKARCLGQQLGTQILCLPQDLAQEQLTLEPPLLLHAQMLCLFVSEECVRRLLPDPILHKLVLAQMNDTISEQLPNFYNNLLQYRAYTAYKMCLEEAPAESAASEPTQQQLIGSCWAKMTGKPQDPAHCQLGSRLYQWMKARCGQMPVNSIASSEPKITSPLRHSAVCISPGGAPTTTDRVMPISSA